MLAIIIPDTKKGLGQLNVSETEKNQRKNKVENVAFDWGPGDFQNKHARTRC